MPGLSFTTFCGPDTNSQIRAIDGNGFEVARFMVAGNRKSFTISRLTSPSSAPVLICTACSSWAGTVRMQMHDAEIKFTDALQPTIETPTTKMTWKQEHAFSDREQTLLDERKNVVATANMKDDLKMEILLPFNEVFLDYMLAGWVAFVHKVKGDRMVNTTGLKVVGSLFGVAS